MKHFTYMLYATILFVALFVVNAAYSSTDAMGDDIAAKRGDVVRCYIAYQTVGTFNGSWYNATLLDPDLDTAWLVQFNKSGLYKKEQLGHSYIQNVSASDCLIIKDITLNNEVIK